MENFPASLVAGYRAFRKGDFLDEKERYEELAKTGQKPQTMIVACCDSRSAPETIFNVHPGEIFVVRNVANLVPPYGPSHGFHSTSAALEFAVNGLKVQNIVVMGHGRCGGIAAALNSNSNPLSSGDFIGKWMELLKPTTGKVETLKGLSAEEKQKRLEHLSIVASIENLRTFPWISQPEKSGQLALHGAWFDISHGELWLLDPESGEFFPVSN